MPSVIGVYCTYTALPVYVWRRKFPFRTHWLYYPTLCIRTSPIRIICYTYYYYIVTDMLIYDHICSNSVSIKCLELECLMQSYCHTYCSPGKTKRENLCILKYCTTGMHCLWQFNALSLEITCSLYESNVELYTYNIFQRMQSVNVFIATSQVNGYTPKPLIYAYLPLWM